MPKIRLEPVRGMRDIIPEESTEILWLERKFAEVAELYGYEPVMAPTVELFSLFEAKSGPEIRRSMYVFKDKAGRTVCLRPEFTASMARIYLRRLQTLPKPVKIFYIGSAFRYEEPQRGRFREFIQAGVEYLGEEGVTADIELLLLIRDYLREIRFVDYSIKLGHMGLFRDLFNMWSVPEDVQDEIIHYIDKKELEKATTLLSEYPRAEPEVISELSKCRGSDPQGLVSCAESVDLPEGVMKHVELLAHVIKVTQALGIPEVYADLGFARGLAYYTGLIFEIIPKKALSLSVGGGGRYDTLVSLYGGPATPATGFALGIDRIHLTLKESGWSLPERKIKVMLVALESDIHDYVDRVATTLRSSGIIANVFPRPKLSSALRVASEKGYDYAIIIGRKEVEGGYVTLKNLRERKQKRVGVEELIKEVVTGE